MSIGVMVVALNIKQLFKWLIFGTSKFEKKSRSILKRCQDNASFPYLFSNLGFLVHFQKRSLINSHMSLLRS